jgi:hypothetical protein
MLPSTKILKEIYLTHFTIYNLYNCIKIYKIYILLYRYVFLYILSQTHFENYFNSSRIQVSN